MYIEDTPAHKVFPTLQPKSRIGQLPIPFGKFDPKDPADVRLQSLVPKFEEGYKFPARIVKSLLLTLHQRHNALMVGPTGVGKTMVGAMLASQCNLPYTRVNLDGDMGRPELIGYLGLPDPNDPNDDGYKSPALVRAIQRAGVVCFVEWDASRPEASIAIQPLLEDSNPGLLLIERDQFVQKHKDCVIIATANTRGMGDETGLYAGTQNQNFAQLNRFHLVLEFPPLSADNVDAILKAQLYGDPPKPLQDEARVALVKFYDLVLSAYTANELTAPLSIRAIMHLALYFRYLGTNALELVILGKLPTAKDREIIKGLAQRVKLAPSN